MTHPQDEAPEEQRPADPAERGRMTEAQGKVVLAALILVALSPAIAMVLWVLLDPRAGLL